MASATTHAAEGSGPSGQKAGELLESFYRFSFSMTLFGVQQTWKSTVAMMTLRPSDAVTQAFENVAGAVEAELGDGLEKLVKDGGSTWSLPFEAFMGVMRPTFDAGRSLFSTTFLRGSLEAACETAEVVEAAMPRSLKSPWSELASKLEAFRDFEYAHQILGLVDETEASLEEAVHRARGHDLYRSLWLLEGLGYAHAEAAWEDAGGPPSGLLTGKALDGISRAAHLPLHTGLGLSLARREVAGAEDLGQAVERFRESVRANARPALRPAVFEALGLVVRNLEPQLLGEVDELLEGEEQELYWHGVGRGLYFTASQALPGMLPRAFTKAREEAPRASARRNALAGLAWALTLVNLRDPAVVAGFVEHHAAGWSEDDDQAFAHGTASAFNVALDAAGGDAGEEVLWDFLSYSPDGSEKGRERWRRLVVEPCEAARKKFPRLGEKGLGNMFHHRKGRS